MSYLAELPSMVAHALPKAPNPDVPFFIDNPVVHNYEMLRSVWMERNSITAACKDACCFRTDFYRIETAFIKHGNAALYPELGAKKQNHKLERLTLMVKMTRPKATETMILRFAESLGLTPCPTLRTISHALHCHGIGNNRDENDRRYWHGIQQSVLAIRRLASQTGPIRSKTDRRGTFYKPEEALQLRFELFRELGLKQKRKSGDTIRRYGMSRPTFYKYLHRFRHYGAWGLVDWIQPGRGRGKISDELELRIIEEKVEHPRFSLDELMARMDLRCSRSALYEVLRYWELLEKERRPVRLRGFGGEEVPEKPASLLKTAKEAAEAGRFLVPKKLNAHFAHFLERMKSRAFAVCDPGPIVLAQFIDDLGVCEALQIYGPKRGEGSEITNLVLLNVCRILAGYETVGHPNGNSDRSVAVAAGVGVFPGKTALYDGFADLKFKHLQALRNDVAARARDLGLIRGERIAQDFQLQKVLRPPARHRGNWQRTQLRRRYLPRLSAPRYLGPRHGRFDQHSILQRFEQSNEDCPRVLREEPLSNPGARCDS